MNNGFNKNDLLDEKLDGGGNPIVLGGEEMDNEYAQLVQDLLEKRS